MADYHLTSDERLIEIANEVIELFNDCRAKGYCTSKGEFCKMAGISPGNFSRITKGIRDYAGERTLERIKINVQNDIDRRNGVLPGIGSTDQSEQVDCSDVDMLAPLQGDSDVLRITKILASEMAKQRESYERIILSLGGQK